MTEIIREYIEMRNRRILEPTWFLKFFAHKVGVNPSLQNIIMYLQIANQEQMFSKLDKEFNLCTLHDKEGRFLKCYPESN
jgi:hypothetical protein